MPSRPAPTARALRWAGGARPRRPVCRGHPPCCHPAPGGCQAQARPRSWGWGPGVPAVPDGRAGCRGCSHHQPGLLRALPGRYTSPSPLARGGDSMAAGGVRVLGAARGHRAGRGLPAASATFQGPRGHVPRVRGKTRRGPSVRRKVPPRPTFPRCRGIPVPAAVPTSAGSRQEAGHCCPARPSPAACAQGMAGAWSVPARCRRAQGHSMPARQNRTASFKDDQAVTGIKLCFDFLISLISSTPRYGVISPRRHDSSFPP